MFTRRKRWKRQILSWSPLIHISITQVPDEIMKNVTSQIPQVKPVPKKLSDFTEEERQNFPKVFDYPENLLKK